MSVEHRRQLLAFFIVALAAVLLIGNGLNNPVLRDAINGGSGRQAAIASGVSLLPGGQTSIELGGSARGTTVIESDSTQAGSGTTHARPATSRVTSPEPDGPGRSDQSPNAKAPAQKSKTSDQKHTGRRTTPGSTRTTLSGARVTDDGTTVHGKKGHAKKDHAKKHGKKHLRDDG